MTEEEVTFSREEKQDLFVFACVVMVWIGIRISGVF